MSFLEFFFFDFHIITHPLFYILQVDSSVEDILSVEEATEEILKLDEVLQTAISSSKKTVKISKQK